MPDLDEESPPGPITREDARGYLFDMLMELAKIAHNSGDVRIAMLLTTIVAVADDRPAAPAAAAAF